MRGSEEIDLVVTQVAIQATIATVMVMRKADARSASGTHAVSSGKMHKHIHGRPVLRQVEMEVTNVLLTKTYKLTEEMNVLARERGIEINTDIHKF